MGGLDSIWVGLGGHWKANSPPPPEGGPLAPSFARGRPAPAGEKGGQIDIRGRGERVGRRGAQRRGHPADSPARAAIAPHLFSPLTAQQPNRQSAPQSGLFSMLSSLSLLMLLNILPGLLSTQSPLLSYLEAQLLGGPAIVPLLRRTRRADQLQQPQQPELLLTGPSTFPPDYEVEDDDRPEPSAMPGPEHSSHTYYNMSIHQNDSAVFAGTYVDVESWIHQEGADGQVQHDHLDDAYRKAAGVKLKFDFPFYGHRLSNLTIATGGFLYVGDQTHSWLAATQYIAPLMANFDTMNETSAIQYGDDGKRMVVEWKEVFLRDNRQAGPFTFQVHLWRNGNITFLYKQVPIPVANISDAQHPRKLGISDAYLFNHKVSSPGQIVPQNKRVIHEYHRITIAPEKIGNNTVVLLSALPTCLEANSCEECIKKQLKAFKCSWCNPKESGKSRDQQQLAEGTEQRQQQEKPFCSDQLGLHRRRQEWIEGNCQLQEENQYCKAEEAPVNASSTVPPTVLPTEASGAPATELPPPSQSSTSTAATAKATGDDMGSASSKEGGNSGGGGGLAFVTLFMLAGISITVWLLYAYFNPHTRSGQLLIKYRPSKWQIPSSHVRYSASVHM